MTRVRLEIDEVQIHRPKKRWKLYFLVVTDHPTEEDKMIITTLQTGEVRKYNYNSAGKASSSGMLYVVVKEKNM